MELVGKRRVLGHAHIRDELQARSRGREDVSSPLGEEDPSLVLLLSMCPSARFLLLLLLLSFGSVVVVQHRLQCSPTHVCSLRCGVYMLLLKQHSPALAIAAATTRLPPVLPPRPPPPTPIG